MYQRDNNGHGCKVKTSQAKRDCNAIGSIKQPRGENSAECLSNNIQHVLNAKELAKSLTTSCQSVKVVTRWRGTTYKQCVIDVTT